MASGTATSSAVQGAGRPQWGDSPDQAAGLGTNDPTGSPAARSDDRWVLVADGAYGKTLLAEAQADGEAS
ncbi:MAG: hypothetical protein ACI9OJ_003005 [Myxococcota bacterium]|jgi:hypothetical protein